MKTLEQKLSQIERMITFIVHSPNKSVLMAVRWIRLIKLKERLLNG